MDKIKRRDFCKTATCALISGISLPLFGGTMCPNSSSNQEDKVSEKITAVMVKVKSQKGSCAIGHKVGDSVKITEEGIQGKICIHALYSMLPAVFAMMFEARFDWLKDPDTKTHACPDAYNPVVFEITRVRGG